MKTHRRSNRLWTLGATLGIALFSTGCILHTHGTRDDYYETQSRTRTTVSSNYYGYVGGHVIPDAQGGGWCFVSSQHNHGYAPDYPSYYGNAGGHYSYRGPVSFYFYGYHPIPSNQGRGWCNLHGRHVHRYHPGRRAGWQYHRGRRYYWYDERSPRRDPHPAEPAWVDRNPRGHPTRGATRGPSRGTAAGPATATSGASRGQPAPARPGTAAPARGHDNGVGRGHEPGQSNGRGHDARGKPTDPVRRYGWSPTTGSVDLGAAESERGGSYGTRPPPRATPTYGATPAPATVTPVRTTDRPSYQATPTTPTYTPQPPRSTYGANPVPATPPSATRTTPRGTYGASRVPATPPSATVTTPRTTYQAAPAGNTRTAQPAGNSDPRWRATPRSPAGTVNTGTSSRTSSSVRRIGPSKAERAKQGDKEDREARGLSKKKKSAPATGTKIRLSPAKPARKAK